jgi:hypothetical protein
MTVMNLDKLEVWRRAKDFAVAVYKEVVPHLPADEKWNLTQQSKRAAQSILANSAESNSIITLPILNTPNKEKKKCRQVILSVKNQSLTYSTM